MRLINRTEDELIAQGCGDIEDIMNELIEEKKIKYYSSLPSDLITARQHAGVDSIFAGTSDRPLYSQKHKQEIYIQYIVDMRRKKERQEKEKKKNM